MTRRVSGFTLVEIVALIVIMSAVALAVIAPLIVSSSALGGGGASIHFQLTGLAREQAEYSMMEFSGLSESQWTQTALASAAASPVTVAPDITLDGETFRSVKRYECVASNLSTPDVSCAGGFARITVTVTALSTGETLSLTLIKTRAGI